jgi:hypothetical protein
MPRPYRRAKQAGHRICNLCNVEKPATPEVFVRDSSRKLGIGYECLDCHHARRKGRDRSAELWPVWQAVQKKHTARLLEFDRRDRLLVELLGTAGGRRYEWGRSDDYRGSIHYANEPHRCHAEVEVYDDNVHLKLSSLPGAVALEVMRLLAERLR